MADQNRTPGQGNSANQFAQVGMGGSLGGGQFEQGEGHSGSLQDQQGGTTTRPEDFGSGAAGSRGDFAEQDGNGQQQQQSREQRAPGASEEDDELGTGAPQDADR